MQTKTSVVAGLLGLIAVGSVLGFHERGVGHCDGCHVTHLSEDGVPIVDPGNPALLNDATPTDVCLMCHATSLGAVFGDDPLIPPSEKGGGNFVFLLEDNLNDAADGAADPLPGERAGHNVIAPSRGITADVLYPVAPGGTFPANQLGCTSCHDPHGNENFRLLNGAGPVMGGLISFTRPAPLAEGIALTFGSESATNHTAYREGMSEWCGNCHGGGYHQDSGWSTFDHPSDETLDGGIRDQYNAYAGTSNPTGGTLATAYLPQVPFEDDANTIGSTAGPAGGSRVMCLSCHRAHASSAPHAGRWDFNVDLLSADGVASGSYPLPDPYADPAQGPLCFKCHEHGTELQGTGINFFPQFP